MPCYYDKLYKVEFKIQFNAITLQVMLKSSQFATKNVKEKRWKTVMNLRSWLS